MPIVALLYNSVSSFFPFPETSGRSGPCRPSRGTRSPKIRRRLTSKSAALSGRKQQQVVFVWPSVK
ncbi:uncharacterized protein LY79DRAFT_549186 [Colletotrichum navitas]|uniref:Uncharacterized protein n=1 Tax=Colletotrichum navitas TaxID=681940 RepID=A0AAD8V7E7_9PEZI|nr:uncharacterized protein LY79DRAFT_549186 [Colletotrichum navitas]KAK1594606.1 hypothetical protein LY79DRAFT_549186 [Colletotrichum navitas]